MAPIPMTLSDLEGHFSCFKSVKPYVYSGIAYALFQDARYGHPVCHY